MESRFKINGIVACACLVLLCTGANSSLFAQSAQTINPTGGTSINFDDGLKIVVNPNAAIAVYRANQSQTCCNAIYPANSEKGISLSFRFELGTNINREQVYFMSCSTTPAIQAGNNWTTSMSGYVISSISKKKFFVHMDFKYTHPNKYFIVDYYVRAPIDLINSEIVHVYMDHDAYIKGDDRAIATRVVNSSGEFVGNYRTPANGTVGMYAAHGFKTGAGFRSFYSGAQADRKSVNYGTLKLLNTLTQQYIDNGVAVELGAWPLSAGQSSAKQVLHGYGEVVDDFRDVILADPISSPLPSSVLTISLTSATLSENEGSVSHGIGLNTLQVVGGILRNKQTASFTVSGVTAVSGTDFSYVKGFTVPAGDYTTPKTFPLNNIIIMGNLNCQSDRTLKITIDDGCNDLLRRGSIYQSVYTIVDDDALLPGSLGGNQSVCPNTKPVFNIQAPTGGTGLYTYQWMTSLDGTNWTTVAQANLASYDPPAITTTTYYRRVVSNGKCTPIHATAVITVNAVPPTIITATGAVAFCPGGRVVLSATSTLGSLFQWYKSGVPIAGATQPTYTATTTGSYTATSSNLYCITPVSNAITVSHYACAEPKDDLATLFECQSTSINVMANDNLNGLRPVLAIVTPPLRGTATVVGNAIRYEDTGLCEGGLSDVLVYSLCNGLGCASAALSLDLLKVPVIDCVNPCSFQPLLALKTQYKGSTYVWEYAANGLSWSQVQTGSDYTYPTTNAGFYRVRAKYGDLTILSNTVELRLVNKVDLPAGTWYQVTLLPH